MASNPRSPNTHTSVSVYTEGLAEKAIIAIVCATGNNRCESP
jgi:hypothetical protein